MNTAYLSLGGNEGDRLLLLTQAIAMLGNIAGKIVQTSAIYQTKAWGVTDQPDFLNMCACIETPLTPKELLDKLQAVELQLGRQRDIKWGPRTMDIDLLFFNDEIINTQELIVPHPYVQERRFVLMPLADIAPDYLHPVFNKAISILLATCVDTLAVAKVGVL